MLDPWIIEEIRRREEEEETQNREQRPIIEVPYEAPRYPTESDGSKQPGDERGVTIVDFTI